MISNKAKYFILLIIIHSLSCINILAQDLDLTLEKTIKLARQQSFEAFKSKNFYLIKSLNYKSFKKMLYPTLSTSLTPGNYDRSISELWSSEEGRYKPYEVQWLTSIGSMALSQPIKLTGGDLNISSSLRRSMTYYENNDDALNYISNPISITYSQNLNAVNEYKWRSRLEPLQFEEAKKQYLEDAETTSIKAIELYYNLLDAEIKYNIARQNKNNTDTLYLFGQQKFKIGAITMAEYLKLELNKVNADINIETQKLNRDDAMVELNNFLEMPRETKLHFTICNEIPQFSISSALAIEKANENNPEMIALEQKIILAQKNIESANSNRLSASFNANIGLNQNQKELAYAYRDLRDKQGVSFTLSMPIIDWGDNGRKIQQARLNKQLVEESYRKQKDALEIEVLKMVNDFNIKRKQVKASALADSISKVAYEVVHHQFLLGKCNIVELNSSYFDLQNAQNRYINTLRSFWLYLYSIRKICLYDFEKNEDLFFDEGSIVTK